MIRNVVSWALRVSERPPAFFAAFAIAALILGFLHEELAATLGASSSPWVGRAAFLASFIASMPIALRDLNLWRFLSPRYRGLDPLLARIGADMGLENALFFGSDDKVRVDAAAVLAKGHGILSRISFPRPDDEAAQAEMARINAMAFSGSRYGLGVDNKKARNQAIARRHRLSFALVGAEGAEPGKAHGLAGTIALSPVSTNAYVQGTLSDNDFAAPVVARPGEPIGSIVFFLIAHDPAHRGPRAGEDAVLYDLLRCCLVQFVLLTLAAPPQSDYLVIAANSNRSMTQLFERLRLVRRRDFRNADAQDVFAAEAIVKNRAAAIRHLHEHHPHLLELLSPATAAEAAA